jgi:hypothetical protein
MQAQLEKRPLKMGAGVELEGVDKKRRRALRLRRVKKGPQNGGRNE